MADEDLKESLDIIEMLKRRLTTELNAIHVGNKKIADSAINKFVDETKKHYTMFQDPDYKNLMSPDENIKMLYQKIGEDFKDLVNKLGLNQSQKDEATKIVANTTNLALQSAGFKPSLSSAGKIIAEDVHQNYQEVVDSLTMTNKAQMDAQAKYKTDVERVISDPKRGNILDEIAKLNAKLQKALNLNDRQINELNIGVSHYINDNRRNFESDLKGDISREEITKVLNKKTAESAQKPTKTRVQAAKRVVIAASKSATKTLTSQWQNPSKSETALSDATVKISQKREKPAKSKKVERSDKNPQIAASNYQKSQEITQKGPDINEHTVGDLKKGTQNNVISKLQNIPKTVKKVATKPTKLEQVYDAAVRGIEADVKQKANAKFTEIKSTVSHKMPPEAKEFATKIGHDALEKARAAAERVKGAKDRIKQSVKKTFER